MRTFLLGFALCLLPLTGLASTAGAVGLNDVVQTLQTPFRAETPPEQRIFDYSADFFQESRIASLDRLQRARGSVLVAFDYQRADRVPKVRFRWEYDQPTNQEIVSDGKTMWVYLPENNQVIQSDIEMVNEARQSNPMTFLTGLGNLSRDFSISWGEPNYDVDGNYVLDMRPYKTSALLNRLVIVVDRLAVDNYLQSRETGKQDIPGSPAPIPPGFGNFGQPVAGGAWFPILSTTVYDPNGNSTIIEFSDLRVNRGVSTTRFSFILPAGVQVVRPTGQEMGF
ncbi:MAG: outer membrane lipoprotein carrier protein LolA [Desulfuromonadales bacterium]|nr:outer membrane lipoprotein carrier protein LolA [Desulfuromonadales bacterium]